MTRAFDPEQTAEILMMLRTIVARFETDPALGRKQAAEWIDDLERGVYFSPQETAEIVPHPTAAEPPMGLDDTARHLAALADEPDALARIRAVLLALTDRAQEAQDETWRERIREAAEAHADHGREHLARACTASDAGEPRDAVTEAARAATLTGQAAALRALLS